MEELLNSGLINLSELARQLYPNKDKNTAANTLRAKINKSGFNKLSQDEKNKVFKVISDYHSSLLTVYANQSAEQFKEILKTN